MATNDFLQDLVDKMKEDNVEYIVIAIQKGKKEHVSHAYFNITTVDGADMIVTTVDEIFKTIQEDESSSGFLSTGGIDDDPEDDGLEDVTD